MFTEVVAGRNLPTGGDYCLLRKIFYLEPKHLSIMLSCILDFFLDNLFFFEFEQTFLMQNISIEPSVCTATHGEQLNWNDLILQRQSL